MRLAPRTPPQDLILPVMFSPHKYADAPVLGGAPREREFLAVFKGGGVGCSLVWEVGCLRMWEIGRMRMIAIGGSSCESWHAVGGQAAACAAHLPGWVCRLPWCGRACVE